MMTNVNSIQNNLNIKSGEPLISFVVPCFNCVKTVERAARSILNQTFSNIQLILVDDGSVDGTSEICDRIAENDIRVKVLHQDNTGVTRAWKNGVLAADGSYIASCDADDYYEKDYVDKVRIHIEEVSADIFLFGAQIEKDNQKTSIIRNRLSSGLYNRDEILSRIYPGLFSNGDMQSELVLKSRWSKCFWRETLIKYIDDIPDNVLMGEDWITVFVAILNSQIVICDNELCSYHYYRNNQSVTGGYIDGVFNRLEVLYDAIDKLAEKYGYEYRKQILADRLSMYFLFMKKELQLNPNGFKDAKRKILEAMALKGYEKCIESCSVSEYCFPSKLFAHLMIKKRFFVAYWMIRLTTNY
ncbi:glycosyltransferase family 2 protein [Butyrivibrio sp. AE3006]|uniref:glycosyltransferase family 2 protein n=1 Tax=Butyrivibrio sp. AE3006 TaxID=1280673 RepID=UPI00041FC56C|nr:glycosyltransferase [Butyrivibrio sp. AE3006]